MTILEIKKIFSDAGWFEGRKIDISRYEQVFLSEGIVLHSKAKELLQEFGDLKFDFVVDYSISIPRLEKEKLIDKSVGKKKLDVMPLYYYFGRWNVCFEKFEVDSYSRHVGEPINHIMNIDPGTYCIWIGESGHFYCCTDSQCIRLTGDFWDVMYKYFNGISKDLVIEDVEMIE